MCLTDICAYTAYTGVTLGSVPYNPRNDSGGHYHEATSKAILYPLPRKASKENIFLPNSDCGYAVPYEPRHASRSYKVGNY